MGQVLANIPYSGRQSTLSGFRVLISELVSSSLYSGWQFMGTVFAPKWVPKIEYYSHFETGSGAEEEDRKIPRTVGLALEFSCDDLFSKNYERWFMAAAQSKIAANAAAVAAAEIVVAGLTGTQHGISNGRQTSVQRTALTVYNVTDSAALVLNTDYKIVTIYGNTFIEMLVDTHAGDQLRIGTGATSSTDYNYVLTGHYEIAPLTRLERRIKAIIQAPSKTGGNWEYITELATLDNGGEFDVNVQQASSQKFTLTMLNNAAAQPNYPWGKFRSMGYDDAGAALI